MVTARDLIAEAESRGARFEVVGDKLRAVPKTAISAELYRAIGEHKDGILALLREADTVERRIDDIWDERLRRWVIVCAETILSEICDLCGRRNSAIEGNCVKCGGPW